MDDDMTALVLHSQEPKIIFHGSGEGGTSEEEIMVELQETVFVSDGDGDVDGDVDAVNGLGPEEMDSVVIQDGEEDLGSEYVHCTEEEEGGMGSSVAVDTCMMSPEGVTVNVVPGEVLEAGGLDTEEDQNSCQNYLMISLDEAQKMVGAGRAGGASEGPLGAQIGRKEEEGQEVIKVYIFKAEPGEDDLGSTTNIAEDGEGETELLRRAKRHQEKTVYMSVGDSPHDVGDLSLQKVSDEAYMKVVLGGEEPISHDRSYDNTTLSKDFMPVTWPAGYGGNETRSYENRNGTHKSPGDLGRVNRVSGQQSKGRKRFEPRHVQTAIIMGPYGQPLTVFPCMLCGKKFKSCGFLKRHTRTHHQEVLNRKKYQCTDCEFSTNKKASLHDHMEVHRAPSEKASPEQSSEVRPQGALSARGPQPLASGKHQCRLCGYEAPEHRLLSRHLLAFHGKSFVHVCKECGKGFRQPAELTRHERTHADTSGKANASDQTLPSERAEPAPPPGERNENPRSPRRPKPRDRRHKCSTCGRGFRRPSELRRHEASHSSVPRAPSPAPAPQPEEPQDAAAAADGRGKRTCEGGTGGGKAPRERRLYQCQYCDYSTGDASGFKRHVISIHTKDYPHRCQFCDKGFRRPSEKNQHILRHHKDLAPTQ